MSGAGVNRPAGPVRRGRLRSFRRRTLGGQHTTFTAPGGGGAGQPPLGQVPGLRWRRGRPASYGVEWPFWLLMLIPWLAWGLMVLLAHLGVCLICLPR